MQFVYCIPGFFANWQISQFAVTNISRLVIFAHWGFQNLASVFFFFLLLLVIYYLQFIAGHKRHSLLNRAHFSQSASSRLFDSKTQPKTLNTNKNLILLLFFRYSWSVLSFSRKYIFAEINFRDWIFSPFFEKLRNTRKYPAREKHPVYSKWCVDKIAR